MQKPPRFARCSTKLIGDWRQGSRRWLPARIPTARRKQDFAPILSPGDQVPGSPRHWQYNRAGPGPAKSRNRCIPVFAFGAAVDRRKAVVGEVADKQAVGVGVVDKQAAVAVVDGKPVVVEAVAGMPVVEEEVGIAAAQVATIPASYHFLKTPHLLENENSTTPNRSHPMNEWPLPDIYAVH